MLKILFNVSRKMLFPLGILLSIISIGFTNRSFVFMHNPPKIHLFPPVYRNSDKSYL